jgi:hypothetical protein
METLRELNERIEHSRNATWDKLNMALRESMWAHRGSDERCRQAEAALLMRKFRHALEAARNRRLD